MNGSMKFWVLEGKYFDQEYQIHSLHRHRESAVSMGQDYYDSLPFDRHGDGVRLRRGILTPTGLVIEPRVLWARYCESKTLAEWMEERRQQALDDEDEDEYNLDS